ncbi:MAG: hypothetical protein V6013_02395 [Candidatus Dasytiphilus stammeri]
MKKVIARCTSIYLTPHLLTGIIPVSSGSEMMINLLWHDGSSQKDYLLSEDIT